MTKRTGIRFDQCAVAPALGSPGLRPLLDALGPLLDALGWQPMCEPFLSKYPGHETHEVRPLATIDLRVRAACSCGATLETTLQAMYSGR